ISLLLSGFKDEKLGGAAVIRNEALIGTYYPYVGVEALRNQPFATARTANVNVAVASFEGKWYPGNKAPRAVDEPAELGLAFIVRRPFGNSEFGTTYHLIIFDSNFYLDQQHHISIGASYASGADPESAFVRAHKYGLS